MSNTEIRINRQEKKYIFEKINFVPILNSWLG